MSTTERPARIRVELDAERSYPIIFASLSDLPDRLRSIGLSAGRCLVVTDENVGALYAGDVLERLASGGFDSHLITLQAGEETKSSASLQRIYDGALAWGIERRTPLLALGGGVIGDLAGFAAATLLRGLPLVQVPTTLIAQVDSAIGGKTGINHKTGKNLIGAFHQPRAVLADPAVLQTLPRRQWTSGLAEVVKHGLIADEALFADLESSWPDVLDREETALTRTIPAAARVKACIVREDEMESGLREILNFGHTFAHALEKVAGYGTFTHGEAVAAGMRAALHLSSRVVPEFDSDRADELVRRIPVPSGLAGLPVESLTAAMKADKKVRGGRVRFVLLDRIGHAFVTDDVRAAWVEEAWRFAAHAVG